MRAAVGLLALSLAGGGVLGEGARRETSAEPHVADAPIPDDQRTRLLVLGSPHLRTMEGVLEHSHLESLLDRLESFSPRVIGVERLPGTTIQAMRARIADFAPVLEQFAERTVNLGLAAQKSMLVDPDSARRALDGILDESGHGGTWTDEERRHAAHLALAAFEEPTALLQWRYLDPDARVASGHMTEEIARRLTAALQATDEVVMLGVELAHRLGLNRVSCIDDHSDKDRFLAIAGDLQAALVEEPAAREVQGAPIYMEMAERQRAALEGGDLLPLYEWMNGDAYIEADVAGQFHLFHRLEDPVADRLGRERSALWEVRNLNIASNVRRATGRLRGQNALVIIGAGHKAFLETYLDDMMDIDVVAFDEIPGGDR